MALSEQVLEVIARVTPEELAETRRWCEFGDRVQLLSDLTEGRVARYPWTGSERSTCANTRGGVVERTLSFGANGLKDRRSFVSGG
ncbi:MAG: hypothetical protein OXE53_09070 [Deltaproteobacteria bacterium]|nr:hypothetical protein [Deltaproteobacteria bacterium]